MQRILLLSLLMLTFAGCTDGADDPADPEQPSEGLPTDSTPAPGFAPQQGHQEAASDDVSLAGDFFVSACEEAYCIHGVATNEGSSDRYVSDICISPWSESMQQRDSEVQKSEPYAVCMAWGVRAFAPGEMIEADFTWDGRLWDDDAQEYRDAPEDSYTWSIHFRYFEGDDGSGGETLTLAFPVIVGET